VFIDLNGNITGSCQQKIYNKNEYYNIYDIDFTDNFNAVIAPVTCKQLGCYCVPEINMAKKIL
jgi:hypothetical protein